MATIEELAAKYGSGKVVVAPSTTTVDPYAHLANKYGSGAATDAPVPAATTYDPTQVPLSGATPEQQAQHMEEVKNPSKSLNVNERAPVVNTFMKNLNKGLKESSDLMGEGVTDYTKGNVASAAWKFPLGAVGGAFNAAMVAPTIHTAKDYLTKFTGNPEFSNRAELVATSGLPIAKAGSLIAEAMPSSRAITDLVNLVGKENIPDVIRQLQSNPRLTLMDVSPSVRTTVQGLAAQPGEPANMLDKVVKRRTDTKLDTVTGAIDEAMGTPVNVREKIEGLQKQLRTVGAEINPVIKNTGPVDMTSVVSNIDNKLKPGVNSVITAGEPLPLGDIEKQLQGVRKFITDDKTFRTDPQSLHNFQSALRAKADDLLSSTSGQDRQLGKALMDVRNQVVDAIDAAGKVPGEYKSKLANYRDEFHVTDAFKKGQLITKNRLGNLEDDPSYWEKWIKNATPAELEAAREGARLAYRQQMGSVTNAARKATDIPKVEFNKEKLELLFGKPEVNKMAKALEDEALISDTNSKLFQGTQTAMRLLGAKTTEVRPDYKPDFTKAMLPVALEAANQWSTGGSIIPIGSMLGIGYPYVRGKLNQFGQKMDAKTNVNIADLASSVGDAKEKLIQALQSHIPQGKLTLAQKFMLALPIAKP
jgi:hypothetical protein